MRKYLAVLGIVLFSAAAVAQAPPVTPAAPAPAPELKSTACGPVQDTGYYRVGGSTCQQARQDIIGVLVAASGCECGFCSQSYTYGPCSVIQGGYSVTANLRYSCVICEN